MDTWLMRVTPERAVRLENWMPVGHSYYADGQVSVLVELVPEVGQRNPSRDDARGGDE
jgi:hypothetical protein